MRVWVNAKLCSIGWLCIGCLLWSVVYAGEFAAHIKNASLDPYNGWYLMNADVHYLLSPKAKEAIQSSIPLFWNLKVELKQQRFLADKTVMRVTYRYRIRYHALLNNYTVKNETTQTLKKYTSLNDALDGVSQVRDLKIIAISALRKDKVYIVCARLEFDKESLPPPLRPTAYLSSQWDLSSEWTRWPLKQ